MRKSYLSYLAKRMAEGDLLIAPRMAWRQAGTLAGRALHRPLVGPLHGMIISTYRCNLRCSMCELWKRPPLYEKLGKKELSTMEMKKVIEDLRRALEGIPATRNDLRRMGVDYLFWGKSEFRYFKFRPNLPVLKRIGSTILYSLVEL